MYILKRLRIVQIFLTFPKFNLYLIIIIAQYNIGHKLKTYKTAPYLKALGADANVSMLLSVSSGSSFNAYFCTELIKKEAAVKYGSFF